tara:strand:- start:15 stop:779 length:765 start_codon:yes stop_codon:yes gene_type:complete
MNVNAQCTPNFIFTTLGLPGIYPPNLPIPNIPMTGIADGQVNVPYSQSLTLVVLEDTTLDIGFLLPTSVVSAMNLAGISTVMTVGANHVTYDITGLPSNLTFSCDINNCQYTSGIDGCIEINGTPTQSGTFPIDVNMVINIQIPAIGAIFAGMAVDLPAFSGQQYDLFIDGSAGINTHGIPQIEIYPNPTADKTTLRFEAVKNIKVYDNLGRLAFAQTDVNQKIVLSKSNLGSGHFIVEITDENSIHRKNLIIH